MMYIIRYTNIPVHRRTCEPYLLLGGIQWPLQVPKVISSSLWFDKLTPRAKEAWKKKSELLFVQMALYVTSHDSRSLFNMSCENELWESWWSIWIMNMNQLSSCHWSVTHIHIYIFILYSYCGFNVISTVIRLVLRKHCCVAGGRICGWWKVSPEKEHQVRWHLPQRKQIRNWRELPASHTTPNNRLEFREATAFVGAGIATLPRAFLSWRDLTGFQREPIGTIGWECVAWHKRRIVY